MYEATALYYSVLWVRLAQAKQKLYGNMLILFGFLILLLWPLQLLQFAIRLNQLQFLSIYLTPSLSHSL